MSQQSVVGVIGFPIKHTLSPVIHNAAINALGLNAIYKTFEVRPGEVAEFITSQSKQFLGTNVTIPHKREVIDCVAELSPVAQAIGAVNTVVRRDGSEENAASTFFGDNTDVEGFLVPLRELSQAGGRNRVEGGRIVILGAGGAARAVAYAVREFGPSRITIVARDPRQGDRLFRDVEEGIAAMASGSQTIALDEAVLDVTTFDAESLSDTIRGADLVVNATPIGLTPFGHITPLPEAEFRASQIVYDLVYRPRETKLLSDARRDGAHAIDGLEMLIRQAAASFVQWFGVEMPVDVVREASAAALNEDS